MTGVHPGRSELRHGLLTQARQQPSMRTVTIPGPVRGLITEPTAGEPDPASAVVLDNFTVTADGVKPRRGRIMVCRIPMSGATDAVGTLFEYTGGVLRDGVREEARRFFATNNSSLYEFSDTTTITAPDDLLTPVSIYRPPPGRNVSQMAVGEEPVLVEAGYTRNGGRYRVAEAYTSGGAFLFAVNGADPMLRFDGDKWLLLSHLKTSVDGSNEYETNGLTDVWVYRNRLFFIQGHSMVAYYHDVNAIHGDAGRIVLHGVFQKGGSLLFGGIWSREGSDGLDDTCVFGTTNGEVAVYVGSDPGDAADWRLAGVYDIGVPLGRNCQFNVGGDLMIATRSGLIPLSSAVQKDVTELRLHAMTRRISDLWDRLAAASVVSAATSTWQTVKWAEENVVVVAPQAGSHPDISCLVVNAETVSWSTWSGWGVQAIGVLDGGLYVGGMDGTVYRCHRGGRDEYFDGLQRKGSAIHARLCTQFLSWGAPGQLKIVHGVRGTWKHTLAINPLHTGARDNIVRFGDFPKAASHDGDTSAAVWDEAVWDEAMWGGGGMSDTTYRHFQAVSVNGYTIALQAQITLDGTRPLECSLRRLDLDFSVGNAVG